MINNSSEQLQDQARDPVLWQEAHSDEDLYSLLDRRRNLGIAVTTMIEQRLEETELQEVIIAAWRHKLAINEQIGDRLVTLGYSRDDII